MNSNADFENNNTDRQIVKGTRYSPSATYNNATYFWRVRALDTAIDQNAGPWSKVEVFKRSWLAQPMLMSPVGGAAAITSRFEWTAIAHASQYELQLSTDVNFSTLTSCTTFHTSVTATMAVLPGGHQSTYPAGANCGFSLNIGGHYYWRVRGQDLPTGVNGVFSEPTHFFYQPPSTPAVTGPPNGAVTAAPVLSWERLSGYARYRVNTVNGVGTVTTVDTYATSYTPPAALTVGETYTWYVVGLTAAGRAGPAPATGDRRQFTVAAPATGPSLDPVAADNGTDRLVMPSMSWQPLSGASYYKVFSGLQNGGTVSTLSGATKLYQPAFTYAVNPLPAGQYVWYAEGYTANGALVGTSATGTFTLVDPAFAQYLSPTDCESPGCDTQPRTPELSWQPVDGAAFYRVWVALDKDFTNTGTSVSVLGRTSAAGGRADVYLDGVRQSATPISFHSSVAAHRRTMYSRSGLANGRHTLMVRVTGTKVAAATSTYVELDAFVAGGVTYQENSAAVRTGFARVANPAASAGSYDTTTQERDPTGAQYAFVFRGTSFSWQATKLPNGGSAAVYIDNVYRGTVAQYARVATVNAVVYRSPVLADGVHQVRLVATGVVPAGSSGGHVSVDLLSVR
ncbi:MAG TPA: hypothetical protein VF755_09160 [Catenuloplanes sp.]